MKILGKGLLVSLGIAASAFVSAIPASAQYYGRGYESSRYDRDQYNRRNIEAQKRAIRAQREAQRGAYRGEAYNRGGAYGRAGAYGGDGRIGTHGPTGGMTTVPGPYGRYTVPVQPGNNNGNN